jgi:MoaA/NifB/PqqE/SkfB family radical SAM enzyme
VEPLNYVAVEQLGLDDLRDLLRLLPEIDRETAESFTSTSLEHTNWILALRSFGTRFPQLADEGKLKAVRTLAGFIGEHGSSANESELPILENAARALSREEILALFPDDGWLNNYLLSIWEYVTGALELDSVPWNVSLPIADLCNARCIFCTSWLDGRRFLDLSAVDAFAPVLKRAVFLGLVGHGEPLAHPQFAELCTKLAGWLDPRAACYTITNGVFLEKWRKELETIPLHSYSISLNAATAETHDVVMGLGKDAFNRIIESVRHLVSMRNAGRRHMRVYITLVVTRQNMHEVAKFIELGNELDVTEIWIRSLLPQADLVPGLNYHTLAPSLHPDFEGLRQQAVEAIARSRVAVKADPAAWSTPVFSPELQADVDRNPPPIIPREEAVRDRELRGRNLFLYKSDPSTMHGRPRPDSSIGQVLRKNGVLAVRTPVQHGAYALAIPLDGLREAAHRSVRVRLGHVEGDIGLGMLGADKSSWVSRQTAGAGQTCVDLDLPVSGSENELIFFNAGDGKARASCEVEGLELHGSMGATTLSTDALSLHPHNALDPLDDGMNPLGRLPRFACKAVYYNLYINELFLRINPCCYMQEVPGFEEIRYDSKIPFGDAWNAPALVELRRRLKDGPLFGACRRCPESW